MPAVTPAFLDIPRLAKLAGLYSAGALPRDFHQSHPIPVPADEVMHVAFFYCKAGTLSPQAGFQLQPPSYIAFLRVDTGEFEEMRAVAPVNFGQTQQADEWIGRYLSPAQRLSPEFLTQLIRMYQIYDVLLPRFAARESRSSPELRKFATEFRTLFGRVAEAPLEPYYLLLGTEFFTWLNQIAGPSAA
jgi:hypothetical protein